VADYLAVFEDGRIVGEPVAARDELRYLRASPQRSFVAATALGDGVLVLDRAGEPVEVPVEPARGIAWSPDEGWTAVVQRSSVVVYPTLYTRERFRLP
jgi:hypothetical protein